jgi:hypothetical protein
VVLLTAASPVARRASAQEASSSQQGGATEPKAKDPYQRSLQVYEFRKAAESEPDLSKEGTPPPAG